MGFGQFSYQSKPSPNFSSAVPAPKKRLRTTAYRIENETPILPHVIADGVITELVRYLHFKHGVDLPETEALTNKLETKAFEYYNANKKFRAQVKRSPTYGRDWLYVFMRHWLAGELLPLYRAGKIPQSFANGEALS